MAEVGACALDIALLLGGEASACVIQRALRIELRRVVVVAHGLLELAFAGQRQAAQRVELGLPVLECDRAFDIPRRIVDVAGADLDHRPAIIRAACARRDLDRILAMQRREPVLAAEIVDQCAIDIGVPGIGIELDGPAVIGQRAIVVSGGDEQLGAIVEPAGAERAGWLQPDRLIEVAQRAVIVLVLQEDLGPLAIGGRKRRIDRDRLIVVRLGFLQIALAMPSERPVVIGDRKVASPGIGRDQAGAGRDCELRVRIPGVARRAILSQTCIRWGIQQQQQADCGELGQ
ncbi:hypothetical protein QA639_05470 [Bradyrhizobium pachyrhizi]|nr:hypothetical protein [Bradyrhizobium pachyrhizi]WFU56975.1 hypothetical protein QA639_05470 [Bradyrhizobium pachyrhizi]